ncbi:MAG: GlsB/YeaQ/YmgE family stress response membrane protein [Acidimicrobiia bacterium]|nr:GlsB/YeaQ/YmgE family stress response membrane protein [Acidimicrobiia bacterium]
MDVVLLVVIASISGSIGARLAGRRMDGCLTSIALGFVGALIGSWVAERFDLGTGPTFNDFPIIWSVIGAALFVAVLNLISGRGRPEE